jgi:hypothetical protein
VTRAFPSVEGGCNQERRYNMKNLDDNYYDVYEMIIKLKGRKHDIEKEIMECGGDGPDWMYLDGYSKCINDLENLVKEEDNV